MHGVGRIELTDKRTSVRPGSLPVYTGPFSLEYYEKIYPTDEHDWDYDWNEHVAEPNRVNTSNFFESSPSQMMMHEETYQEKIETADESKMAQCKAFMKIYYLAVCALCWTVLILVGLGIELWYFTKGPGSVLDCGDSPTDMCRYGSDCTYDEVNAIMTCSCRELGWDSSTLRYECTSGECNTTTGCVINNL